MDIKEIIKTYGLIDYYDMNSGRIFHNGQYTYDPKTNVSEIPVSEFDNVIGYVKVEGDIADLA